MFKEPAVAEDVEKYPLMAGVVSKVSSGGVLMFSCRVGLPKPSDVVTLQFPSAVETTPEQKCFSSHGCAKTGVTLRRVEKTI